MTEDEIEAKIAELKAETIAVTLQLIAKHRTPAIDAMDNASAAQRGIPVGDWRVRRIAAEIKMIDEQIELLEQALDDLL